MHEVHDERLRGEVLTTRRYTNLHLPLPFTFYHAMPFDESHGVYSC